MVYARARLERIEAGKAYGIITAKALAVLGALLWGFHDVKSGQCDPSQERIRGARQMRTFERRCRIKALEQACVITWANRIIRERKWEKDLFGRWAVRWPVVRTSNAYVLRNPKAAVSRRFLLSPKIGREPRIKLQTLPQRRQLAGTGRVRGSLRRSTKLTPSKQRQLKLLAAAALVPADPPAESPGGDSALLGKGELDQAVRTPQRAETLEQAAATMPQPLLTWAPRRP